MYDREMVVHIAACESEPTRHGNPKKVLLRGGVIPKVTQIAIGTFPECVETELHSHPTMYEMYFVLEGTATYRIGDQTFDVAAGDFFFVPPGVTHNQRVTSAPHRVFYWGLATD
jgi:quercetin dioxygenase-like cupin family protein